MRVFVIEIHVNAASETLGAIHISHVPEGGWPRPLPLDVHDLTFPGPGKVGLWTKSDVQAESEELRLQAF